MTTHQFHHAIAMFINDALKAGLPPDEIIKSLEMHKLSLFKQMTTEQPIILTRKPLPPGHD